MALTDEVARVIVAYVRGGAFDYVAAEAAGISARTFRSWMARAEGNDPSRTPTPKLRRFAAEVRRAKAEARISAEARVFQDQPRYWLSRAARTKGENEGWSDPRPDESTGSGDLLEQRIRAHEAYLEQERGSSGASGGGDPSPSPRPWDWD